MTFCELKKEDVKQITEFYQRNFPDGWTENMLLSAFDGGRFFAISAKDGERIIGIITFTIGLDDADIEGVVTDKDYRNCGVASALIKLAEEKIAFFNIKKILLEVRESNQSAKNLYIKSGFKSLFVRRKYYLDGENAVVMIKESVE